MDCIHSNRLIIYYPNGPSGDHQSYKWHYSDELGYTTYYSPLDIKSLAKLVERVTDDYEDGKLTDASYHWFTCVTEVINE